MRRRVDAKARPLDGKPPRLFDLLPARSVGRAAGK